MSVAKGAESLAKLIDKDSCEYQPADQGKQCIWQEGKFEVWKLPEAEKQGIQAQDYR
jgi:hypothetical protein